MCDRHPVTLWWGWAVGAMVVGGGLSYLIGLRGIVALTILGLVVMGWLLWSEPVRQVVSLFADLVARLLMGLWMGSFVRAVVWAYDHLRYVP